MRDREPTMRSRELGGKLRQGMVDAGLNGRQTAHLLGWSEGKVSRLLSGKRGGGELDVAAFLALCRDQDTPGWLQQHGSRLPKQLVTLIDHEDRAVTIGEFQSTVVPGLLQTGDYARALIQEAGTNPADEINDRVAARLARQSLFSRDQPVRFTFYVHEFVLRLPVGGSAVMFEQLQHLLRMAVPVPSHPPGDASQSRGARRDQRIVHPHGVPRVPAGGLPGE